MQEEGERRVEPIVHVRVAFVSAYDVRRDGGHQVDDVVVERLGEAALAGRAEARRGRQVLDHRLHHQLEEEPRRLLQILIAVARREQPLHSQLFVHQFRHGNV